ncbi:hypothetical protein C1645_837953 [Glomus cerebriforme]|uniref:Uncharacterized protein n=1 Tax=Glomus cerebriforme TaxID=658196 RepID=A0A397S965_9GLOM|nr:hypothetical protein C1645_837953 [Glomus cerebriforme]
MKDKESDRPSKRLRKTTLEKFKADVNYQGLIEEVNKKEKLEDLLYRFIHAIKKQDGFQYHVSSVNNCLFAINHHLNNKSILPKPINIMDKDQFYKLWQVFNSKVKNFANQGLGKCNGSDGFTKEEFLKIINHPAMSENPTTDKLYIPEISSIIEMYENYFSKQPIQADSHFYLQPCNNNEGIH